MIRPGLIFAVVVIAALACSHQNSVAPTAAAAAGQPVAGELRLAVFISDLHVGVGRTLAGEWSAFEDFRWESEFRLFLERVDREGDGRSDLVLNGDTFELWQSLDNDCAYPNRDLGCTEAEALQRIRRVMSQHPDVLKALGAFAAAGNNTVTIVPGNHDAALLFPAVADAVRNAIGAPAGRLRIPTTGNWRSADGLVYAEHGHQIGAEVNRFDGWPQPFVAGIGGRHLRRPWGEQFVQDFYNRFEAKYPIIDNISDERDAVRLAMKAEGGLATVTDSAEFIRFFLLGVSWRQFGASLKGEGTPPDWDIERIQSTGGQTFIVESFMPDDPVREALELRASQPGLPLTAGGLNPDEIRAICDQRAAARALQKARGVPVTATECPVKDANLRAIAERLTRSRDQLFSKHLKQTLTSLGPAAPRFAVFVYSHTHLVDKGFDPLRPERIGWDPHVVNTGAWQRVVSSQTIEKWNLSPGNALRKTVEMLPACYSVVWIAPYNDKPVSEVRSWRQAADGSWDFGPMCEE